MAIRRPRATPASSPRTRCRIFPEALGVSQTDGYYTWDSNAVLSYTVKALRKLNRKVDALAAPSHVSAVRLAGVTPGSAADTVKLHGVVADLSAVTKEQQRRIEVLERTIAGMRAWRRSSSAAPRHHRPVRAPDRADRR